MGKAALESFFETGYFLILTRCGIGGVVPSTGDSETG